MQKTGKKRLRRAEYVEWSYCKLTLKAIEHIPMGNSQTLKLHIGALYICTKLLESFCAVFFYTGSQSDNSQHQGFRGSQRQSFAKSAMF